VISALVAFRETGDGHRTRLWDFVRARLAHEMPEVEIVVGTDDGEDPFNKCLALNRAAARATGDIFYILDADTLVPAAQVREAAALLAAGGWSRPWRRKVKLAEGPTAAIIAQDPVEWDGTWDTTVRPERVNAFWSAPPLMVTREMFDEAGGMDERYRGWGGEDSAFARTLWQLGHGLAKRAVGDCMHLWHPRLGTYGADRWPGQDQAFPNSALDKQYSQARSPRAMRELIAARMGEGHGRQDVEVPQQVAQDQGPSAAPVAAV